MSGLRSAIKASLPESWEYALRKNKVLVRYIEGVYQSLDYRTKGTRRLSNGKPAWKNGITAIKSQFSTLNRIELCLTPEQAKAIGDSNFWNKVNYDADAYQYNHK